ncbi:hypothetical protein SLE2022_093820 [Rubroshorea leprosula]
MADLILGPVVDATVSKVTEAASEQLKLALEWKDDLRRFCFMLEMIRGVLLDADEKHVAGHSHLKPWLRELRSVVDEADDVLEEIDYENLRRQVAVQKPKWKRFGRFFTPSNPLAFRLRMANRVKNLNVYLADINDWASRLGLQYKLANTAVPEPRVNQQTHSLLGFSDPSQVVGRNEDVDELVRRLTDSRNQEALSVISVVGMPGLGKTTLVKAVCAVDKITEYFGKKIIWVCVSENFDVPKILGEMLESLTKTACTIKNIDTLLQKIGEELGKKEEKKEGEEGENYLLILDDVWNEKSEKWDYLKSCLLGISKKSGNRVVVTSRSENVASTMDSIYTHHLKQLEADTCWSIIERRAFGGDAVPQKLEEIGKDIANKCGGVPLVANVVGGTLGKKRDENEWLSFKEKVNVLGSLEDQHRRIMDVLRLSFERLPKPALKQCFAFCSIFPKDFVIEKEKLIQLWMAEGYLQSSKESSMEDVGGKYGSLQSSKEIFMENVGAKYFTDFLSYSLFQEEARDSFDNVKSCKIHDLIHDFAQSINYSETVIVEKEPCSNIPHHFRHLNLNLGKERVQIEFEDVAEKLQTLFSNHGFPSSLPVRFRRLRVLSVCDVDDADPLPSCFGNLKSLRYLDISGTPIRQLPKFITKMYNLQTFRFTNCKFLKMPLKGIGHLVNLRHIYFEDEDRMPAHIGRLTSLQTLQKFFVGEKRGYKIEELGKLSQLRGRLEIFNLECVKDKSEAQRARLKEKAVEQLEFSWGEGSNHDKDVLEGLQPPSNLQILGILGYGGRELPSWMLESHGELFLRKNLVKLNIKKCQNLEEIPLLEGFSSLRLLHIEECSNLSKIEDGAFEFTPLEELSIRHCDKLESVPVNALTSLQTLKIGFCKVVKLNSIGDSLSTSKYLKWLLLSRCDSLKSVPSLKGLTFLKRLNIISCYELEDLPNGLSSCTALEDLAIASCRNLLSIPEELKESCSLVKLDILDCEKLTSFPKDSLGCLNRLKRLSIGSFSKEMEEFPDLSSINASLETLYLKNWRTSQLLHQIQHLTALKELTIEALFNEEEAPWHGLEKLSSLTELRIFGCEDQISLSKGLKKLPHLTTLRISDCHNLISLPEELFELPQLKTLSIIGCDDLVSFPEDLKDLHSLVHLRILRCPKLRSFPGEILDCLTSLKILGIGGFSEELEEFPGLSSIHDGLEELTLIGWDKLTELPSQIQHLTALKKLTTSSFKQVIALPEWVGNFSSLQSLTIFRFDNMKHLPSAAAIQRLSKFQVLEIRNCPKLQERCAKKRGSEWSKISHIPEKYIPDIISK